MANFRSMLRNRETPNGAILSDDGTYRYLLWRGLDKPNVKRVLWIMLNPSTADASIDDPTVKRCQAFSKSWGFDAFEIVNLYAYRSSKPADLKIPTDPVGPDNDDYIQGAARRADLIICAWGNNATILKESRDRTITELLVAKYERTLQHIGTTASGQPKHPLARGLHRIPDDQKPLLWAEPASKVFDPSLIGSAADFQSGVAPDPEPEEDRRSVALADEPPEWDPSKDQTKAFDGIMSWWKSSPRGETVTLGGYAGVGKSFMCGKLSYDLLKEGVNVAFAAPTGKAALVLKSSLEKSGVYDAPVSTIHGLIYIPETDIKTGRVRGWKRQRDLPYDLIIVDEASMVSAKMLSDLESYGVNILAIGDHGQLPPVGEKAGLMRNPTFRLEKIHRQAKGNPIIRLATLIRNGAPNEALKNFIRDQEDPRLRMGTEAESIEFAKPPGMLITYTNKKRTALNDKTRYEQYGYDDEVCPQVGETVICLKNHRPEGNDGVLIANGMRGEVVACEDDEKSPHIYIMSVQFDEPTGLVVDIRANKHQFLRDATFKGFDEVPGEHTSWWTCGALLDFGFSLTGHKSQGSQALNVAVFMNEWAVSRMSEEDQRRWKYTAVTRAADKLMLVC